MPPIGFKAILGRVDPGTFNGLMGRLLRAEASRLRLPLGAVVTSDALNDRDGGLDARIDDVPAEVDPLPPGLIGMQFKAVKAKAPSSLKLDKELAKAGPTRTLKAGGTYILVWSADLNPGQKETAEEALYAAAAKIVPSPKVELWDASSVDRLADRHPAVLDELDLAPFGALRGLAELAITLKSDERPFESDLPRAAAIEEVRARASTSSSDPLIANIVGLAGTGKTRVVAEALGSEDLCDSVLYTDRPDDLHAFAARAVKDAQSEGIIVLDELHEDDRRSVHARLAATRGRWRTVTIIADASARGSQSGGHDLVIPPLEGEATQRLIQRTTGLNSASARMVAEVARGFPELAFRLAEELQLDPRLDLVRLARLKRPSELLRRALPDDDLRAALKPVALFAGVGFSGGLEYQLEAVAAAFHRNPRDLDHVLDNEARRGVWVSTAGRYRSVSPAIVAVWLAYEMIEETPDLDRILSELPQPLQEAFARQLELFGPTAEELAPALDRFLQGVQFREPESFDAAAGNFLRASAAVAPSQVAAAIAQLIASATEDQLRTLPRRDLVWALQILLWWPETWDPAVTGLYAFARNENESWANNATASFQGAFSVYLSGSTVPISHRQDWLQQAMKTREPADDVLLATAAAAGLAHSAFRTVVGFRGGGEPADWQPKTVEELRTARMEAWRLLLSVYDGAATVHKPEIAQLIGGGLATLLLEGMIDDVEVGLLGRQWSVPERVVLLRSVSLASGYEHLAATDVQARLDTISTSLRGGDSKELRVSVILASPFWDLHERDQEMGTEPQVLVTLANALNESEITHWVIATTSEHVDRGTRFSLLRALGRRLGAGRLVALAKGAPDPDVLAAAFSVADDIEEGDWVDQTLTTLERGPQAELIPRLVTFARLKPDRVGLALRVIGSGEAPAAPLGALRARDLSAALPVEVIDELLGRLTSAGEVASALAITAGLASNPSGLAPALRSSAGRAALRAVESQDHTGMVDHYIEELVSHDALDEADLAAVWNGLVRSRRRLAGHLEAVVSDRFLSEYPAAALAGILALIRDQAARLAPLLPFGAGDLQLLSRASRVIGAALVWEAIRELADNELRVAVHHMRWGGDVPDQIVARLLESDRLAAVANEAAGAFFNALGVVTGDYWRGLEGESKRAAAWCRHLSTEDARAWAAELVGQYEKDVAMHKRLEEEENLRLGL